MRLEIRKVGSITVIDDCYNANPASMANALECLGQIAAGQGGRTIFICGLMGELGEKSEELHAQLGELIAQAGVNLLLVAGPFAQTVENAAKTSAKCDFSANIFENTDDLCDNLAKFVQSDDIVLVKGSRTAKLERTIAIMEDVLG